MGDTADDQAAGAADAFTAVAVEGDRFLAAVDQIFVEEVEHLEQRHLADDVADRVVDQLAGLVGTGLAPNTEFVGRAFAHRPTRSSW